MQVLVTLVLNIVSFITSYILEGELNYWWNTFKYKRIAWLAGTFLASAVCVGLVYLGAPLGVDAPGPFIWDGVNFIVILAATTYYTGQTTYAAIRKDVNTQTLG